MGMEPSADLSRRLTMYESSFPSMVQLFLVHYVCNSKCRYCPVGMENTEVQHSDRKKRDGIEPFLSWEIFHKVVKEVSHHPGTILRFHGRGEPLMHPKFGDMVRSAKEAGISRVTTFTNGILMKAVTSSDLLDAGIDLIEFSLDAITPETYALIRGTARYEEIVGNVIKTIELRDEMKKSTKIAVSAVNHTEFMDEKNEFLKFWKSRADEVIIRRRTTFRNRVGYGDWQKVPDVTPPCPQPWTRFNVSPSGNAVFCANDWGDELVVGNLNESDQTIEKIWCSERYREMRLNHLEGKESLCQNCTEDDGSRWKNSYESIINRLESIS